MTPIISYQSGPDLTSFNGVPGSPVGDATLPGEALLVLVAAGRAGVGHPGVVAGVRQGQVPIVMKNSMVPLDKSSGDQWVKMIYLIVVTPLTIHGI